MMSNVRIVFKYTLDLLFKNKNVKRHLYAYKMTCDDSSIISWV